ncbi:hypothetical protein CTAYLR_010389 [Chrysophaeum taylorii]|uniref:PH domain-containing protein n=1 Tax=Chrysophaeum taylorii TaxID=2483200 RepID=A0AAD7XI09_9STRA|nr:hypothetical protein CTAYLR_010389 [Chrysophaeum taylorii]
MSVRLSADGFCERFSSYADFGAPQHLGWVNKKGPAGHFGSKFCPRYFVIRGSRLEYYAPLNHEEKEAIPEEELVGTLEGCVSLAALSTIEEGHFGGPEGYVLTLATSERAYALGFKSAQERAAAKASIEARSTVAFRGRVIAYYACHQGEHDFCGWIVKKGAKQFVASWKKRWATLDGASLKYFEKVDDAEAKGGILVKSATATQVDRGFGFAVTCAKGDRHHGSLVAYAETAVERDAWLVALNREVEDVDVKTVEGLLDCSMGGGPVVRQYAKLCGSYFQFFRSRGDRFAVGDLFAAGASEGIVPASDDALKSHPEWLGATGRTPRDPFSDVFAFTVHADCGRVLECRASAADDFEAWMGVLKQAVDNPFCVIAACSDRRTESTLARLTQHADSISNPVLTRIDDLPPVVDSERERETTVDGVELKDRVTMGARDPSESSRQWPEAREPEANNSLSFFGGSKHRLSDVPRGSNVTVDLDAVAAKDDTPPKSCKSCCRCVIL